MKTKLWLRHFDCNLRINPGDYPILEISISAVVTSIGADMDVAEQSAFEEKVRAFVERELPKHIKIREAAK